MPVLKPGMDPTVAPTNAQLAAMSDQDICDVMDWWALGNNPTVGYVFWHEELRRRAEQRLSSQLLKATSEIGEYSATNSQATAAVGHLMEATNRQTDAMAEMTRRMMWLTFINVLIALAVLGVAIITLVNA